MLLIASTIVCFTYFLKQYTNLFDTFSFLHPKIPFLIDRMLISRFLNINNVFVLVFSFAFLLSKIEIMNNEKKFYKKIFLNSLLPNKNVSLPAQLYKSVDQIWYLAGDTSIDFNFYTKRLILAGIYTRVVLFFFNNNNQQELENLLDVNLKRVAKIPELKSKIKIIKDYFPKAMKFVKKTI